MIQVIDDKVFVLTTAHTTYAFGILPTGQPEHLAYGGRMKIDKDTAELLGDRHAFSPGNAIVYDAEHPAFSLEDARLEASFYGKGDIREPFAEIVYEDGSFTSDFLYDSYLLTPDEYSFEELPGAYAADASDANGTGVTSIAALKRATAAGSAAWLVAACCAGATICALPAPAAFTASTIIDSVM